MRFPGFGIHFRNQLTTAFSKRSAEGLRNRIGHHHEIRLICWHPMNEQHGSRWQQAPLPVWPTPSALHLHAKHGASSMIMWGYSIIRKHLPGTKHHVKAGFKAADTRIEDELRSHAMGLCVQ